MEGVIAKLLDKVGSDGRFDLVADLAEPMPASVIAEMFRLPQQDHARFRVWAEDLARFFGGTTQDPATDALKANAAATEFERYFLKLYEARKKQPGDDLMSLFLAAEEAGKLSAAEVVAQCQLILVAGHVTTIDQLANGVYAPYARGNWNAWLASDLVKTAVKR